MLRKITIIVALVFFSLAIPCAVLARDATSSTTRREKALEKVEVIKDKMASREATMKAKLQAFKDKRKAGIADRVNTTLNQINKKQTEQMLKYLDNMSRLLDKLEARVNTNTPDIKDPAAAKAAIASARAKIATASAAVNVQAAKDYTITVTIESKIRADAQAAREKLHTDLKALRQQVVDAKQAVANAIRTTKSGKEATSSGRR